MRGSIFIFSHQGMLLPNRTGNQAERKPQEPFMSDLKQRMIEDMQ